MSCVPDWFQAWMLLPVIIAGVVTGVLCTLRLGLAFFPVVIVVAAVILVWLGLHPSVLQYCTTGT